jgi:hypothetical protein
VENGSRPSFIPHSESLIDDEEFILLFDLYTTKSPDLPYCKYNEFDLDKLNDDECITEFRFLKGHIYILVDAMKLPEVIKCYIICISLCFNNTSIRELTLMFIKITGPLLRICQRRSHQEKWVQLGGGEQENGVSGGPLPENACIFQCLRD